MCRLLIRFVAVAASAVLLTIPLRAQSFEVLEPLHPSKFTIPTSVSADGSFAAGFASSESSGQNFVAVRWRGLDVVDSLGYLPGHESSRAHGISANGTVVVGYSQVKRADPTSIPKAFRWTDAAGMQSIGSLGSGYSEAVGVSADGSVVAGSSSRTGENTEAFRWTVDGGIEGLGFLSSNTLLSQAHGISPDGVAVVGLSVMDFGEGTAQVPFRWTAGGRMEYLGSLGWHPGGVATDATPGGEVVVGMSFSQAFLWRGGAMQGLGLLNGLPTRATGVSADGSVVVGYAFSNAEIVSTYEAFIWTAEDGMRALKDVLENDYGLDLAGWTLWEAIDISDNGTTIVGFGRPPEGQGQSRGSWRAVLAPTSPVVNDTRDLPAVADRCDVDAATAGDQCTLRAAIEFANANAGRDSVSFDIDGAGPHVITLDAPLPALTEPLVLDATTQPGYAGTPLVVVRGSGLAGNGLVLDQGESTVRGLAIGGFSGAGIRIAGPGENRIEACHIGVGADGVTALPNGVGVLIEDSPDNVIGGSEPEQRNVISGNAGAGVLVTGAGAGDNVVAGNYFGTNAAGAFPVPNGAEGVRVENAPGVMVGGDVVEARNVIAGNGVHGVYVRGADAEGAIIRGNYIGVNAEGTERLGNGADGDAGRGIFVQYTNGVVIGGTTGTAGRAPGNVISANGAEGIRVEGDVENPDHGPSDNLQVLGNLIGLDAAGLVAMPNGTESTRAIELRGAVRDARIGQAEAGNVIVANGGVGINLAVESATRGAPNGAHIAANKLGLSAAGDAVLGEMVIGISRSIAGATTDEGGIRDVVIGGEPAEGNLIVASTGIFVSGVESERNIVASNMVGLLASGALAITDPEKQGLYGIATVLTNGVEIVNNTVGGYLMGLVLGSNANVVHSNRLGTNPAGTSARPNNIGLSIPGEFINAGVGIPVGDRNIIGGSGPAEANVISGNLDIGLSLGGPLSVGSGKRHLEAELTDAGLMRDASARLFASARPLAGIQRSVRDGSASEIAQTTDGAVQQDDDEPDENLIMFNKIGTNAAGTRALGNGLAESAEESGVGAWVQGGKGNVFIGNLISGNGGGLAITHGQLFPGQPSHTVVAANVIGLGSTSGPIPNQFGGVFISGSSHNQITATSLEEGGEAIGNVIASNGGFGVRILSDGDRGPYNTVRQSTFEENDGPAIELYEGENQAYPPLAPQPPRIFSAVAGEAGARLRVLSGATGPLDVFYTRDCEPPDGTYALTAEGIANVAGNVTFDVADLGGATAATAVGLYLSATSTSDGETATTSAFATCFRIVAEENAAEVFVPAGETGNVFDDLGLDIEVTSNSASSTQGSGRAGMKHLGSQGAAMEYRGAEGSLYVARYDLAPDHNDFEGEATAPDGSIITPDAVSSQRYWTLRADGLDGVAYTACLDVSGLGGAEVPGQLLVVQRVHSGAPWTPYASTLEGGGTRLCAEGLMAFGDLGIGANSLVNPVPVEPAQPADTVPTAFGVPAAYPNPARGAVTVEVALPQSGEVRVEVFDILGRSVDVLLHGHVQAGTQRLTLNTGRLAAGIYLVHATTRSGTATRRVTVVR